MSNFCPMPWKHLSTNTFGEIRPCCVTKPFLKADKAAYIADTDSLQDTFNCDEIKQLRLDFLAGKKPEKCATCWHREKISNDTISVRISMKNWWSKFIDENIARSITAKDGTVSTEHLGSLELCLGNKCNLKCVTCHPGRSSFMYNDYAEASQNHEFYKYGTGYYEYNKTAKNYYTDKKPGLFKWFQSDIFKQSITKILPNLFDIYWAGGEPMIIKEHKEILENIVTAGFSKNVELRYDTNATIITQEYVDLFKKFDVIDFSMSLDDIKKRNEYIRFPSEWERIEKNLRFIVEQAKDSVIELRTSSTINAYNILTFTSLPDWIRTEFPDHYEAIFLRMHFKQVTSPYWTSPAWMPPAIKKEAINRIDDFLATVPETNSDVYRKITMIRNYLVENENSYNELLYKQFVYYTKTLDRVRGTNFPEAFPDLYKMLPDYDSLGEFQEDFKW